MKFLTSTDRLKNNILLVFFYLFFALNSFAQPGNDACSNATPLPCGTNALAGTTIGSISETSPGCVSNFGVWYTFVGDGNSNTITVQNVSLDTEMALFTGSCGSLALVGCLDASGASDPEIYNFTASLSTTYYLYIGYYSTGSTTGNFTVSRECLTPPTNDLCANATPLPCGTNALPGTTINSVSETSPGCVSNYGVWYTFTGDGNNNMITVQNVSLDTEMALFTGSCGSLTSVGCLDASGASDPEIYDFVAAFGVTYYLYIGYFGSGTTTGDFTVSRECFPPPINDACADATILPCGTNAMTGTTSGAVPETSPGCVSDYGVWYTFDGDGNSNVITVQNVSLDTEMALFTGSCGSLTNVTCLDAVGASNPETYNFVATLGTTYYLYIGYFEPGTTTGDFTVTRSCFPPPANDLCADATPLPCGTNALAGSTTASISETSPGCVSNFGVWYTFTGDGDVTTITTQNVSLDVEFELFSGSCGSLTSITCEDAVGASNPEVYTFSTTNGLTYYIYVGYFDTGSTTGDFTISRACSAASTADCAGATQICNDQTFSANSDGYGLVQELNSSNYGCFAGGTSTGEDQSSWYYFQAAIDGVVEFTINPSNPATDYDFIIWGPNSNCATLGSPIRCNAAGTQGLTGMVTTHPVNGTPVTNTTSAPGFSSSVWIQSMPVVAGEIYIMMIENFTVNSDPFTLDWDIVPGLLNCTPISLPVEFGSMWIEKIGNNDVIYWNTISEYNSNYFIIERSSDNQNWSYVASVPASNNSTTEQQYSYKDEYYERNHINYYRLSQTDIDGTSKMLRMASVDNRENASEILRIIDLSGRIVNSDYRGIVIIQYTDGSTIRILQ